MSKFTEGQTYTTRSICDADMVIAVTVAKRTAKTIVTTEGKRLRIHDHGDCESVRPWGSYSMAPKITSH